MRRDVPIQGFTRGRTPRNRSFRVGTRVWLAGALAMLIGATPALGGSSGVPFRGALVGTASTLGRVTLRRNGIRVVSLKFGQYRIVVDDATPHSGFVFERPNGTEIVVTSTPFVG